MDLILSSEDLSKEECELLEEFRSNGLPGLAKITDVDISKWFRLYISGKTYTEISKFLSVKKELILYISVKGGWHNKKINHYSELANKITSKIMETKIDSAETMTTIISALNRYFGDKFNKFIATNEQDIIEGIDPKLLAQYYKSIDTLDQIVKENIKRPIDSPIDKKPSQINVNINNNSSVEKKDEKAIEITDENAGQILEILVKQKKESENNS